jgi:hypothetical protein
MSDDKDYDELLEILGGIDDDLDDFLNLGDDAQLIEIDAKAFVKPVEIKDLTLEIEQLHRELCTLNHFELIRIANHVTNSMWNLVNAPAIDSNVVCTELIDEISANKFLLVYQKSFFTSIISYFSDQNEFSAQAVGEWLANQEVVMPQLSIIFWNFANELVKMKYSSTDVIEKKIAAEKIILAEGYYMAIHPNNPLGTKSQHID